MKRDVDPTTATTESGSVRAVSRAWQVLRAFSPERMSLTPADLVRETGLPRTTVLRLVETLAGEGLVESGQDGRIRVGTSLIAFSAFAETAWTVPPASLARMRALAAETGETVSLYVRSGTRRVVVGQAPSPSTLRHVVEPGDVLTLSAGSAAYVLLGLEPPDVREELVARIAEETGAAPGELGDAARGAAERGWWVTHGEREPGNSGLAVPVPFPEGGAPARPPVLAVGGPTVRFTEEKIPGFVAAARACARDLAGTGLPPALY
ncbi:IclR family transcriptional regulator [Streptomyces sp. NPDC093085]|uniref:IclR family transcriptional regulator n=1 Tax=Streptomyces sp. NPDC093085 TaxID=3155068 RepID=UPI003411F89F